MKTTSSPGTRLRLTFIIALLVALVGTGTVVATTAAADSYGLQLTKRHSAAYLSWTAQEGAASYDVQSATNSKFTSASTRVVTTNNTIFNRLSTAKTYYFRVRVTGTTAWSTSKSVKPSYPTKYDTGYKVEKATKISTDDVSRSAVDLTWTTPSAQYACYRISVSPAPTGGQPDVQCTVAYTITGLKRATKYQLKIYTVLPAEGISGIAWPDIDITGASKTATVTTTNSPLEAPADLTVSDRHSSKLTLTWTAPTSPAPSSSDRYRVQLAANPAMTKSVKSYYTTATQLELKGLSSNQSLFARVTVVDSANKARSDKSSYVMAKTLITRGTIKGTVSTEADVSSIVARAYTSGNELAAQSELGEDGSYSLPVRPGTYKVRIAYIGSEGYKSAWTGSLTVKTEGVTTAAQIAITK